MIQGLSRITLISRDLGWAEHLLTKLKRGMSLAATVLMAGCMQTTLSPSTDVNMTSRDRQLLTNPPYIEALIPEQYRRHLVDYDRPEKPGAILVDSDAHYLYFVLPDHKALRYGVAVGEDAMAFWGPRLSAERQNGRIGCLRQGSRSDLGHSQSVFLEGQPIHSARAHSIFSRATPTRCTEFTAPTSRNTSASPSRPAASA
jgi:hypothetical protein